MVPIVALVPVALSILMLMARYARIAKAMMTQLLGKNMIGSLRNGHAGARPPQALPNSSKADA